nr:retroelement Pol polyprotein-like [Tanacetum cinerariifolium]
MKLVGYSDSSHNADIDDGRSKTGHVFYLGACQAIWLRELLAEVTGLERQKVIIIVDNKSSIMLSKNLVLHGRSKHIHTRCHFIRECMENMQVMVEHISGENQRANPLMKALDYFPFVISKINIPPAPQGSQCYSSESTPNPGPGSPSPSSSRMNPLGYTNQSGSPNSLDSFLSVSSLSSTESSPSSSSFVGSPSNHPSRVSTTPPIPTLPPPPPLPRQRPINFRQNPKQRFRYSPSAHHATTSPTPITELTSFSIANKSPE